MALVGKWLDDLGTVVNFHAKRGSMLAAPVGVKDDDQLKHWIQRAVKFVGKLSAK